MGLPVRVARNISLSCDCPAGRCNFFQHSMAYIGGKKFNAGQQLIRGHRCGSVVTCTMDGRSLYGLVKQFLRVICECAQIHDFAIVTWFPRPSYPDGDPLTVKVDLDGVPDVNNMDGVDIISLYDIEPSRVAVGHDTVNKCMFMMRMEGTDRM